MGDPKTNGASGIAAVVHVPRALPALAVPQVPQVLTKRRATPLDITRIAARAEVAPNTVRNYLAGRPTYSTTRSRIEKALVKCGLPALVRSTA